MHCCILHIFNSLYMCLHTAGRRTQGILPNIRSSLGGGVVFIHSYTPYCVVQLWLPTFSCCKWRKPNSSIPYTFYNIKTNSFHQYNFFYDVINYIRKQVFLLCKRFLYDFFPSLQIPIAINVAYLITWPAYQPSFTDVLWKPASEKLERFKYLHLTHGYFCSSSRLKRTRNATKKANAGTTRLWQFCLTLETCYKTILLFLPLIFLYLTKCISCEGGCFCWTYEF